mmetsp:Transcript_14552/g.39970  ORF Transcript_14552/g.39970 Transcript_14552/m.39970 type:complete len:620 (-) Transcript_14552:21-1880(-)
MDIACADGSQLPVSVVLRVHEAEPGASACGDLAQSGVSDTLGVSQVPEEGSHNTAFQALASAEGPTSFSGSEPVRSESIPAAESLLVEVPRSTHANDGSSNSACGESGKEPAIVCFTECPQQDATNLSGAAEPSSDPSGPVEPSTPLIAQVTEGSAEPVAGNLPNPVPSLHVGHVFASGPDFMSVMPAEQPSEIVAASQLDVMQCVAACQGEKTEGVNVLAADPVGGENEVAKKGDEDEDEDEDETEDETEDEEEDEEESDEEDTIWSRTDEEAWNQAADRDYYAALKIRKTAGPMSSRARAAYHRESVKCHPDHRCRWARWRWDTDPSARAAYKEALVSFWTVTEAYLVLKDAERKRVYDECGLECLRKSEDCQQESIFDADAFDVYEGFFEGRDPEDRDFLLMNGTDDASDEEGWFWDDCTSGWRQELPDREEVDVAVEAKTPSKLSECAATAAALEEQLPANLRSTILPKPDSVFESLVTSTLAKIANPVIPADGAQVPSATHDEDGPPEEVPTLRISAPHDAGIPQDDVLMFEDPRPSDGSGSLGQVPAAKVLSPEADTPLGDELTLEVLAGSSMENVGIAPTIHEAACSGVSIAPVCVEADVGASPAKRPRLDV